MRTTVTIDDEFFERALSLVYQKIEKSKLCKQVIETFMSFKAGKWLASLLICV